MDALQTLVHGLHLIALALWTGGMAALLVVLPAGRRAHPSDVALRESARRRAQTVAWWALITALCTLAAEVALRTQAVNDSHGFPSALKSMLFHSRYGVASVARWVIVVAALWAVDEMRRVPSVAPVRAPRPGRHALGIVAGLPDLSSGRRPSAMRPILSSDTWLRIAALLAGAVLVCTAIAGPFGGAPVPAIFDTLHLGAAMLWLGGTIVVALAVVPCIPLVDHERRALALLALLDRFTPIAVLGALVLAVTGLWEANHNLAGPHPLVSTLFGLAFGARAIVLAALVGVSAWGALTLRPRLRRLALRARRHAAAQADADAALAALLRPVWVSPALAAVALCLGAIADIYPDRPVAAVLPGPAHPIAARPASGSLWQPLGPRIIVHSVVIDPANHARLYEGTVDGVYRSTDGGKHWSSASAGLVGGGLDAWSLSIIPDGSLIAATADGMYRSTDGATHWSAAGLGGRTMFTLATHRAGHIVLLAGGDGGVFRSDDLAATWSQIYSINLDFAVTSLAWPSVRPQLIVAGINPGGRSIAVSRDGGVSWHVETKGLPSVTGMMSVAVAPGARDVYAGMMGLGAYVSPGVSGVWEERSQGLPGLKTGDTHIGSFAFDPFSPKIVYTATPYGVYRSTDAGRHWLPFGNGLTGNAADVVSLALATGPHPALYAATVTGVYRLPLATRRPVVTTG